jgi:crossover junction endodeoxyribonuclease RusA
MFEANKKLPAWREQLLAAFVTATTEHEPLLDGALTASMVFYMPKPKTSKRAYPDYAPDVDKLIRSVGDQLQQSGLIKNDGQLVSITAIKYWATETQPPGLTLNLMSKVY